MRRLTLITLLGLLAGCTGTLNDWGSDLPRDDGGPPGDGSATEDGGTAEDLDGSPDDGTLPEDPPSEVDPEEDPPPEEEPPRRPVDPEEDPPPDDPPPEPELAGPGGRCACDSDCEPTGGYAPLCIHGICGVRATDDACPAGSSSPCPAGHRCWSGTGRGVCYPDHVPGECAGARDGDGSCVTDGSFDCYAACGVLCDLPGEPPSDEVEPPDDPPDDPPDGPCTYPAGPYGWREGAVVAPMRWTSAVAGSAETGRADLESWYCDEGVNAIFVEIVATYCTACPERMRMIAGLRDHWIRTGVRWVFLVADASSPSQASAYIDRYGIDFGFRTNDGDNSEGPGAVTGSPIYGGVPWTGVIRASDMVLIHDESDRAYLDLESIASELAR